MSWGVEKKSKTKYIIAGVSVFSFVAFIVVYVLFFYNKPREVEITTLNVEEAYAKYGSQMTYALESGDLEKFAKSKDDEVYEEALEGFGKTTLRTVDDAKSFPTGVFVVGSPSEFVELRERGVRLHVFKNTDIRNVEVGYHSSAKILTIDRWKNIKEYEEIKPEIYNNFDDNFNVFKPDPKLDTTNLELPRDYINDDEIKGNLGIEEENDHEHDAGDLAEEPEHDHSEFYRLRNGTGGN